MRGICFLAAVTFYSSCGAHQVNVTYDIVEGYQFSQAERRAIETTANRAADDVRRVLPTPFKPTLRRFFASRLRLLHADIARGDQ